MIVRRLCAALALLCLAWIAAGLSTEPAHANCTAPCTKTQITTDITTNWPDNTTGSITPALLRSTVLDLVNSYMDINGSSSFTCTTHQFLVSIATLSTYSCAQPAFTDISGTASAAQLPNPTASTLGGIESLAAVSHQWINTISTSGVPSATQPACGDLSNGVASCSTDTTNAANISSGTLPFARLPVFARATSTPGNPGSTVSTSAVMMGLAGAITPAQSGNILFQIRFDMQNSAANDGCVAQLMRGTGSAPANGAASTGSTVGGAVQLTNGASIGVAPAPASALGYAAGLTVSTAYWYDLSLRAVTGGTCAIFNITMVAIEE